jgi:lipopolysaccharide transport protein LptA
MTPPLLRWLRPAWLLGSLPLGAIAVAASGDPAVPPKAGMAIGVAPFERVAPPGASVPDVALLLADRLASRGVQRIVGPASLGARAISEPSPEEVVGWAEQGGVDTVVVGRSTRVGRSLSVDLHVRSGRDGAVLGTYVEEVDAPAELGSAVDRLAAHVTEDSRRVREGAANEAPPSEKESARREDREEGNGSLLRRDKPIQISSAQLEAFDQADGKRLIFTDDVRASQGDLSLNSQRLEAFYPPDSSQPERLVASGSVVVRQQNRTARCDTATYLREDQLLVCEGDEATLTQDEDRVQGRRIVFHLDTKVLTVQGGARVNIRPDTLESQGGDAEGS